MTPALLPAAAAVLAGAAVVAALPDPVASAPRAAAGVALMTAGWLAAGRDTPRGGSRGDLPLVLAVAVAARLLLLAPAAPLSDDLYRYLWEGRVGNAGFDPFRHAPAAPELAPLRDAAVWPRVNHPDVSTIYPPVAQLAFRAQAALAYEPRTPRVAAVLADLAAVLLLAALLRRRGRPAAQAAVLAWCPLAILESAGGGHVDGLGSALLLAALLVADGTRTGFAGALLAASALVKPVAVLLVPRLLAPGPAGRRLAGVAGAALVSLAWIPYLESGGALVAGLRTYAEHWHFNDALFTPLTAAGMAPRPARALLAAVLLAVSVAVVRRPRDPLAAAGVVLGAMLFLSPTVHPWYGVWLVPFLPFLPAALRPAGMALCALLPLAYVTPWQHALTGVWHEPAWPRVALWGTVAALGIAGALRARPRAATR